MARLREEAKRWIPFGGGVASLVIGLFFLAAWHASGEGIFHRFPLAPMKYNTALCLGFCGAALAFLGLRRDGRPAPWVGWLGWLVVGIGALSALEYLLGRDFGIDRAVFDAPDLPGELFPDRMSLLTAVCFVLLGAALGLCGRPISSLSPRRYATVGILSCIVGVVVSMSLVGYLFGIKPTTGWGVYARMSGYATLALFLCSGGLLVWAGRGARRIGHDFIRWLPATGSLTLMAMIALICATGFAQLQDSFKIRRHSNEVLTVAQTFRADIFDIQRGMRGYALTGQPALQEIYLQGAEHAEEHLGKLTLLVGDNPGQLQRLAPIPGELAEMIAYAKRMIAVRDREGISGIVRLESDGVGFHAINRFLADMKLFTDEENRLLVERRTEGEGHFQQTVHLLLFGCAMAAALLVLAHALTDREARRRRQTEDALRTVSERFALAADASQTGVWDLDLRTRRVMWDRRMFAIYGCPEREGMPLDRDEWASRVVPEDLDATMAGMRRVIEEKGRGDTEFRIRLPDGTVRHIYMAEAVRLDAAGNVTNLIGVNIDVTERKRMELALHEKNVELENAAAAKNRFLANMSHELRTPLNCIIGFSELLVDGLPGEVNEEQREYLGDILTSSNHLLQLINDVLDLAKVESGKIDLAPETFSLPEAIERVRSVVYPIVRKKRIELTSSIAPGLDKVTLDPRKFRQVLYNLLSNAVKFTPADGCVDIGIALAGDDRFTLVVRDTGIGIRPENVPRLFREFEQLDDSYSRSYQGTGLGLALTRKIVEMQGGTITVESVFGRGSSFIVTLPRVMKGENPTS
ncbi:PAS domain S-box-containing protein [Verrucomicrobium sp. GAS474]|nr:PAS domain S-box-containing protein [Verrucomicrobium sp. GAS474]